MACYAAVLSLSQTLYHIKNHPRPPISLDQHQLHSLTQNLTFFQDFLECYSGKEDEEFERLESRITSAAYAAEDAIESHVVYQIHARSNITTVDLCQCLRVVMNLIEYGVMKVIVHVVLHRVLARVIVKMDLIKKDVMEVMIKEKIKGSQHQHLHTSSTVSIASVGPASAGRGSTMARFDDVLLNKVLDKLTGQQCGLQIIPIVGMGGIGKTTLALDIYTKPLIVEHFDIRAWVTVSQEYSRKNILQVICEEVKGSTSGLNEMSEDEIGLILHKHLYGRRYLIVMDDMWSIEAYDRVKSFFPNNRGSRIMITTRLSNLASELSSSHVFQMQFLNVDKSWDLLCETMFGKLDCPNELETIGKEIARSCRGLPLSIVVIGGLLAKSKGTQAHWEHTLQNLNSLINLEDDEYCLQILRTSYKELPIHLKPCFLYMGIFREDSKINVSNLIKLWVSEGILKLNDDKSLEEVAKEYLNELIERNLLLVAALRWNGEAKVCKIHDLLRDVCMREAKKQKFFCVVRQQDNHTPQGINMERRICINHENTEEEYSPEFLHAVESALFTRSLLYCMHTDWLKDSPSLRLQLLRVYSSADTYLNVHTYSCNAIYKHANLRYLSLKMKVDRLWSLRFLCSLLWNMQTLKVCNVFAYEPTTAPSVWEMPLLRHVMINDIELPDPPNGKDNIILENLQTLSSVWNLKFSEEVVKRMPNVKKLKVFYKRTGVDEEEGLPNFCLNNLGRLQKLESLNLAFALEENIQGSLLSFPHSLKKLSLCSTKLSWEDLTTRIGSLPLLQLLSLHWSACAGPKWETVEGKFCSLRVLEISRCDDLEYWDTNNDHFPRLEQLRLRSLEKLEEIPSSIGDIPTLKSIRLERCSKSASDSARRIKEEQEENGNEDLQLIIG